MTLRQIILSIQYHALLEYLGTYPQTGKKLRKRIERKLRSISEEYWEEEATTQAESGDNQPPPPPPPPPPEP